MTTRRDYVKGSYIRRENVGLCTRKRCQERVSHPGGALEVYTSRIIIGAGRREVEMPFGAKTGGAAASVHGEAENFVRPLRCQRVLAILEGLVDLDAVQVVG